MEDGQNQISRFPRFRHNPPPIYGDTAGAPDPNETSLYDFQLYTVSSNEQFGLATTEQFFPHVPTLRGTRTFNMHEAPTLNYFSSSEDPSTADDLELNCFFAEESFSGVQSIQMDHEFTPIRNQMESASFQDPYFSKQRFWNDHQEVWLPTQFIGENYGHQANWSGNDIGMAGMNESMLAMELGFQNWALAKDQSLQNNLECSIPHNSLQLPSREAGDWQWEDDIDPCPPQKPRLSKMRRTGLKRNFLKYRSLDPEKIIGKELHGSHGQFGQLGPSVNARNLHMTSFSNNVQTRERKEDACIKCTMAKKKCQKEDELDSRCHRCFDSDVPCLSTKSFLEEWKLPAFITETRSDLPHNALLNDSATIPKKFRASIYVSYGSDKLGVPLRCKVTEIHSNLNYKPRSTVIWQNSANPKLDKNCLQKDRLRNFIIPDACEPPLELIFKWAVESVEKLPPGVVEECYGPLYTFSLDYVRIGTRPLCDLVALALVHTAMYNVCHSRMTIVFDCNLQAPNSLPDRIRDQICMPLLTIFKITGNEIRRKIKKALRGRFKKDSLAFYVALCLLIVTYEHIPGQIFLSLDYFKNEIPKSNWEKIQKNLTDLRLVQECLFGNMPNLDNKEFDLSWKGDKMNKDDHMLEEALSKLRKTMPKHRWPKIRQESIIAQILAPEQFKHQDLMKYDQWPTTEHDTISTSRKLDLDNMSAADTGLGSAEDIPLPSLPQVLKRPDLMFSK